MKGSNDAKSAIAAIYRALDDQRKWVPTSRPVVIFRTWANGRYAPDYGYRAWPLHFGSRQRVAERVVLGKCEEIEPYDTGRSLASGLRAGDRTKHKVWGVGTILLVEQYNTIFHSDRFGLTKLSTWLAAFEMQRTSPQAGREAT